MQSALFLVIGLMYIINVKHSVEYTLHTGKILRDVLQHDIYNKVLNLCFEIFIRILYFLNLISGGIFKSSTISHPCGYIQQTVIKGCINVRTPTAAFDCIFYNVLFIVVSKTSQILIEATRTPLASHRNNVQFSRVQLRKRNTDNGVYSKALIQEYSIYLCQSMSFVM